MGNVPSVPQFRGLNIDEPLVMLRSATTSYYQADGLGSITSLTNTSGAAAETYSYESFGNILATTGSLTNSFKYTGREFDTETSLYYYRARYYDPAAGRFVSEDLARWKGGLNFYSYAMNSPVGRTDPYGLWTFNLGGTFNGQIGAVNLNFSGGLVIGSNGLGSYITPGIAAGVGEGIFFGLSAGFSNAKTICGFGGAFYEGGQTAGTGVGESTSYYTGLDPTNGNKTVSGGSIAVGVGGGASVYNGITNTTVTPIVTTNNLGPCGCQ